MTPPAMANTPAKSTGQGHPKPGALTHAALLPWYAVPSGTYGLYFYILLTVPQAGRLLGGTAGEVAETALFIVILAATVPLATLVLLAMPAGAIWAALRPSLSPGGLLGLAARTGCIASMSLSFLYAAIITGVSINSLANERFSPVWQSGILADAAILLGGLAATWKAWRWLRNKPPTQVPER